MTGAVLKLIETDFAAYLVRRNPVQSRLIKLWLLNKKCFTGYESGM